MSDPIKTSLEAAARAMVRFDWRGAESIQEFEHACWPDREEEAAAAIAAFLRALDSGVMPGQSGDLQQWIFRKQWENMAAAVERAGRA